jgi:para-nitrobenzyl esterase
MNRFSGCSHSGGRCVEDGAKEVANVTRKTERRAAVWLARIGTAGLVLSVLLISPLFGLADPVRTNSGLVSGSSDGGVRSYRGIPYAAPPVGDLRWRPPQPVKAWTGVRAATEFGAHCIQSRSNRQPQSEDCLFLNVVTPARAAADKLPVMVWFHGGGFQAGTGADETFLGQPLARKGAVVVSFNYRVNVFGFLAHAALTAESPQHSSGNYGLLDQIAALKWVQANIAAFGGDPARVTIFGVSAGGSSVCRLILSPLARGLFQGAIAESPGGEFTPLRTLAEAQKLGEFWGNDIKAMRSTTADALSRRPTPPSEGPRVWPTDNPAVCWVIVDGWVIPKEDVGAYESGRLNAVPLVIGNNEDEIAYFFRDVPRTTLARYRAYVQKWYPRAETKVLARYPASSDVEAQDAFRRLLGDAEFNYGAGATAQAMSRWQKVFRYHFTRARGPRKNATHGDEAPYIFGILDLPFFDLPAGTVEPVDQQLSEAMMSAWVRFAATGDPNGGTLPKWPAYTRANDAHVEFGNVIKAGRSLHAETIKFWDEIFGRR